MTTHHVATETGQTPDASKAHSGDLTRPEPALKKVPKKVSGKPGAAAPTCDSGPPGAGTTVKEHIMSTTHDFRSSTSAIPSDDMTAAAAWASSPLGNPAIEDGSLSHPNDFDYYEPASATAKPRSTGRNALVAAAVVGAIGAVATLGVVLVNGNGSSQPKPAVVIPGSHVGTSTPQAPSSAPSSPVTPPDTGQVPTQPGPTGGGDPTLAPAPSGGATPADPGTPQTAGAGPADPGSPPAGTPDTPPVIVPVPPVIPVPVPIPVPPWHPNPSKGRITSTPNGGRQGTVPNESGTIPNGGQQGMTPNGGQQGMTPNGGQQGMTPNGGGSKQARPCEACPPPIPAQKHH
jgi:hypothetical protein